MSQKTSQLTANPQPFSENKSPTSATTGPLCAGIELGGTKTVCIVARPNLQHPHQLPEIVNETRIPTTTADETLTACYRFLCEHAPLQSLGIGSFGPLNIDPQSPAYGVLEATPKIGWEGTQLVKRFSKLSMSPIIVDTDVNAAGLGEFHFGAGRGLQHFIYVTLGTGIGGGIIVDGRSLNGLSHPEMGHMVLARQPLDQQTGFNSHCPFHDNCVEGLASGAAIVKRWRAPLCDLPVDHPAWDLEASYLADFIHTLIVALSPQRIIIGGGVAGSALLSRIRAKVHANLNGYICSLKDRRQLENVLVLPELEDRAGVIGAWALPLNT